MARQEKSKAGISRREALAGMAGTALLAPTVGRAAFAQQAETEIVFSFFEDTTGATQAMIEQFNTANQGQIQVSERIMPRRTDDHRRVIESDLLVGSEEIDVLAADVIWTAQFAHNGWVRDLTGRFFAENDPNAFLRAAMQSTQYRNRTWGVPWFTDTGMIFYRKDLLEENGQGVPTSWDELSSAARAVMEASSVPNGFVFQGAAYEGGVTNALEYIWSAGGRVMVPQAQIFGTLAADATRLNTISIDSPGAARGLDIARELVASGAAPEDVANMDEAAAEEIFLNGEAVFLRSWPSVYSGAVAGAGSITPEQIGIMPIPSADPGRSAFGCLGGWNLMISSTSTKVDAAWTFIRYATSPEAQKLRAVEGSYLPTLHALYEDEEVTSAVPVMALGRDQVENARQRDASPVYDEVSPRIAIAFNRVLKGELSGEEAVARLDRELKIIMRKTAL